MNFLKHLILHASNAAQATVHRVLDEYVFPWYEAKTGKYHNERTMRKAMAKFMEKNLSTTSWISKDDQDRVNHDDASLAIFIVMDVFPQSRGTGDYDLMVTISEKGRPHNVHTVTITRFLQDLEPYAELTFHDHNA